MGFTQILASHLWLTNTTAMKRKNISDEKCAQVKGSIQLNIKRTRTEPRQKIRQLLRGFIPLDELQRHEESDQNIR